MNALSDSIIIESRTKRIPKSKSGRLLCAIRDKIIDDMKAEVRDRKFHVPTDKTAIVANLNRRIKKRLVKEDRESLEKSQQKLL